MIDLVWTGLAALALLWPSRFIGVLDGAPLDGRLEAIMIGLLFHGTSLRHNDTGLRPWTLFDGEVWANVGHSLAATVFMTEPPHPDPRAIMMIVGALVLIGAVLLRPLGRRVPAVIVLAAIGGTAGAFLAHAHGYPGRFSIHLIPFACALTMCVAARR